MALTQVKLYSEDDYYNLPEDVRAELIEGNLIYNQAAPSMIHQTILSESHTVINNYIKSKGGSCRVYPAPFAVKLREDQKTIVEPDIVLSVTRTNLQTVAVPEPLIGSSRSFLPVIPAMTISSS